MGSGLIVGGHERGVGGWGRERKRERCREGGRQTERSKTYERETERGSLHVWTCSIGSAPLGWRSLSRGRTSFPQLWSAGPLRVFPCARNIHKQDLLKRVWCRTTKADRGWGVGWGGTSTHYTCTQRFSFLPTMLVHISNSLVFRRPPRQTETQTVDSTLLHVPCEDKLFLNLSIAALRQPPLLKALYELAELLAC